MTMYDVFKFAVAIIVLFFILGFIFGILFKIALFLLVILGIAYLLRRVLD